MANEIRVQCSLQVTNGNLQYQNRPTAFNANQTNARGPSPGVLKQVNRSGTLVTFPNLTQPGWCRFMNLSLTNYIEIGAWDADTNNFFPLMELLPGDQCIVRLSRYITEEIVGTGTSTTEGSTLRVECPVGTADVLVEAFDT